MSTAPYAKDPYSACSIDQYWHNYISGGVGGSGGMGGQQGGAGGTGEGPKMYYDVKTPQFTVNNLGVHIHGSGSEQQRQMNDAERTEIIDWLSPMNFFLRHADISQARQQGTGGWLLMDTHFQKWEFDSGRTLWCHGIPGAGKTVLASLVVEHLSATFQNQNIGVACIYLAHKEAEDQTPTKLLTGLWRQLVLGKDVGSLAKQLYWQHKEKRTTLTLDQAFSVLYTAITGFSKVYMVIDAVDEYPEVQRQVLFKYLGMLGSTVNLMITSRPHITLHSSLPNPTTLEIRASEDDIRKYVDDQIQISWRLTKHIQTQPDLREEIHSAITHTVDGM
ncbi:ANK-REP-REGION domain-containing protein [Mycena venus]|uniref:ANK-REP-REGION domain-containing protein n=1 Tax=Mycena venus TaxID=2733690 RepID=A0A8H7CVH1_9AGAR|nr:ANK-REP-REGION domain-containing protein [Mycena venus]